MNALPQVRQILSDLSGLEEFPDDIRLGEGICGPHDGTLGLDSLDRIEAAMRLEEAFGIEISESDIASDQMRTPAGIAAYIEQRLAA